MTIEPVTPVIATPAVTVATANAQTEPPAPAALNAEHMVPKSRLDEVLAKAAQAEKELKKFQDAEAKRADAQLTKEQLLEKRTKEAEAKAVQVETDAKVTLAKATDEAEAKLLKAAFLLKAKDMGFENPADAFALASKTVTKKDGEFEEVSIEAALKPLIGRLPVKARGDGKGTPKLPQAPHKSENQKTVGTIKSRY